MQHSTICYLALYSCLFGAFHTWTLHANEDTPKSIRERRGYKKITIEIPKKSPLNASIRASALSESDYETESESETDSGAEDKRSCHLQEQTQNTYTLSTLCKKIAMWVMATCVQLQQQKLKPV